MRRIRATLCSTKKIENKTFWLLFCVWCILFSVGCCPWVASYNTLRFSTRQFPRTANMKRKNFSRLQLFSFFVCVLISNIRILCIIGYLSKSFYFYLKRTAAAAARLKGKKRIQRTYSPKKNKTMGARMSSEIRWGASTSHQLFSLSLSLDYYYQKPELLPFKIRGQQ